MPAEFRKMGIVFQYPENWTLDEEDALAGNQSVTVHTPEGGFWSVSVYPRSIDPAQLAKAALDALKDEYEGLEAEEARETIAGHELAGYDFNFFYLDLTNTAAVRCIRTHRATYSIFFEAEDRELARVRRVFQAMTTSLLQAME